MAYTAPEVVPRVEKCDVVPHFFPGLQSPEAAVAPAVKSFENKIDLLGTITLVSDGVPQPTISTRYASALTTLKNAYKDTVNALGPHIGNPDGWPECHVYAKCAELPGDEAGKLDKAYQLVSQMPPSGASFVKFVGDRCGARMLVTKSFLLSFITEFVRTADAYRLKADLKKQYLLNDGATAEHVQALADRHVAVAGSAVQRQALEGTGVAPDTHTSAPLALASSLASGAPALTPRASPEVVELSSSTALAAAPMSQAQLISMVPEGEARTAVVVKALENLARAEEVAREREEQRRDAKNAHEMQAFDTEHRNKMAVIDEERESIRAERKRKDVAFAQLCDERSRDLKRRKLDDLEHAIGKALDDETRSCLEAKKAFVEGLPTTTTTMVVNAKEAAKPVSLRQQVMESSCGTIEFRLAPGTALVDLEFEKRTSLRGWVQLVYPSVNATTAEVAKLGKLVHEKAASMGGASARVRTLDGSYAANTYFVRDLIAEPLCIVIEAWAKGVTRARAEASKPVATNPAFAGFVALGRRV